MGPSFNLAPVRRTVGEAVINFL